LSVCQCGNNVVLFVLNERFISVGRGVNVRGGISAERNPMPLGREASGGAPPTLAARAGTGAVAGRCRRAAPGTPSMTITLFVQKENSRRRR
jgi:hypothetical protein